METFVEPIKGDKFTAPFFGFSSFPGDYLHAGFLGVSPGVV
jgi:hypothetical protein